MRIYFLKATHFKRSIVSRSNFQGILRLQRSFNFKWPVHMIPGVSQRKSYVYFDGRYI